MPQPLIIADPELVLPPDQFLWTTPDMCDYASGVGIFTSGEASKCFFGRSTAWIHKWVSIHKRNVSTEFGVIEPPRGAGDRRHYRYYDIERLAHAFAEQRIITGAELSRVVLMIKLSAQMAGYVR